MKVNSSFGIPEEHQEAMAAQKAKKEAEKGERAQDKDKAEPEPEPEPEPLVDDSWGGGDAELPKKFDYVKALKDLGIELTEDDLLSLIFRGGLEKTIDVIDCKRKFTVVFKTLNAEESILVDTIMATEMKNEEMTNNGYQHRLSIWTLSFGILKMQGADIAPVVLYKDTKEIDLLETAKGKHKIIKAFMGSVVDVLAQTHARFTMACDQIVKDPESPLLKRP